MMQILYGRNNADTLLEQSRRNLRETRCLCTTIQSYHCWWRQMHRLLDLELCCPTRCRMGLNDQLPLLLAPYQEVKRTTVRSMRRPRRFMGHQKICPLVSIFSPDKALPALSTMRMLNYAIFLSGFNIQSNTAAPTKTRTLIIYLVFYWL
jgi:hypothetical protein